MEQGRHNPCSHSKDTQIPASYHPCKNTNVFSSAMEVCNTQRLPMHRVKEALSGLT